MYGVLNSPTFSNLLYMFLHANEKTTVAIEDQLPIIVLYGFEVTMAGPHVILNHWSGIVG